MAQPICESTGSAVNHFPRRITLNTLAKAAQSCRGCDLYCRATQAVFGEGPASARLILIGEQPGDQEDLAGKPFVGPAGKLLDDTLEAAGVDRKLVYVTNAVKHFKWEGMRGKRRLHSKPGATEIAACRPWLMEEIRIIQPSALVTLGATAAQSLLGKSFRLTQHRGEWLQFQNLPTLATLHPSALLRMPHPEARHQAKVEFLADLKRAAKKISTTQ